MQWIYENNTDNSARFVLGQIFNPLGRTLICIGINPSTATPETPDNTIRKLVTIGNHNGYENWIMLNVYPQRATDPNEMHQERDEDLVRVNLSYIREIAERYPDCDVLLAYGNLITKRAYLRLCLEEVLEVLCREQGKKIKIIKLTKSNNPVHPLYQRNDSVLVDYAFS